MITEQGALLERAKQGDREASEALVVGNTGLIWSIARRYFGRGVDPDDLYQLGCLGFLKAVEGFDPQYGTQFSTYAVPKIAGEIRRFLRVAPMPRRRRLPFAPSLRQCAVYRRSIPLRYWLKASSQPSATRRCARSTEPPRTGSRIDAPAYAA